MSVPDVLDTPIAWIDLATAALEGENEVAKKQQAESMPGGVQEARARIHGGR